MSSTLQPVIVWFRDDLRIADNPALTTALEQGKPVIGAFIHDEESPGIRKLGGATKWWLHQSLSALSASLADLKIPLILRKGPAGTEIKKLVAETNPSGIYWNRRYGCERFIDSEIKKTLISRGIEAESFNASLLFEPWTIQTKNGEPYSVFTPFWKACVSHPFPRLPFPAPAKVALSHTISEVGSLYLDDLELCPMRPDWASGLRETWNPGEIAAQSAFSEFLTNRLQTYPQDREVPALVGTSRLSPHLRWGEISPYQVWHGVVTRQKNQPSLSDGATVFLREIGWREFAWHTFYHFPELATRNWRASFEDFPWPDVDDGKLQDWQTGRTGIPLVDAGMRELWNTGWMHNRVRMITASFLTKNLLIDWREGEKWFWDTLVDADPAINPFNWQWSAGSGADASPYFRIFNPEIQARQFDPQHGYIKSNVREWGTDSYPPPIVDLGVSRTAALAAYETMRTQNRSRDDDAVGAEGLEPPTPCL